MKVKSESEVTQSCPTLSDPMDCSLPGSSAHGIFQARVLEWGASAFSNLALHHVTDHLHTIWQYRLSLSRYSSKCVACRHHEKHKRIFIATLSDIQEEIQIPMGKWL